MTHLLEFGIRVRAIREACGYSQERLAELANLHRTYIGGVERGERNISLVNIWRISDALGTKPSALFEAEACAPSFTPGRTKGQKGCDRV